MHGIVQVWGSVETESRHVSITRVTDKFDMSERGAVWQQAAAAQPPITPVMLVEHLVECSTLENDVAKLEVDESEFEGAFVPEEEGPAGVPMRDSGSLKSAG